MKIRRLAFENTDEGRERASLLYQGFIVGGNVINAQRPKGMEIVRREADILDKFQRVGTPHDDAMGIDLTGDDDAVIALKQAEYDLLRSYFQGCPWATRLSQKIRDIDDWLSAIPIEEGDA